MEDINEETIIGISFKIVSSRPGSQYTYTVSQHDVYTECVYVNWIEEDGTAKRTTYDKHYVVYVIKNKTWMPIDPKIKNESKSKFGFKI